jgi:predicted dienelactone hydrolase
MRWSALLLVPLFLFACDREPVAPDIAPQLAKQGNPAGSYEVGFTYYMIHDASRGNRPIPVYVWYPVVPASITGATPEAQYPLEPFFDALPVATSSDFEKYGLGRAYQEPTPAAGPFPLIMFSPGWGGTAYTDALYLGTTVARHGFVLAAVTHWADQSAPIILDEPLDHIALASFNRPLDISAALSDLLAKNGTAGQLLHGVIDPGSVIASGWSLGGYASIVLAAGDDGVCDLADVFPGWPIPPEACGPNPADPRIRSIIPLDGSGWLMHFDELTRVTVPALGLGEEWSTLQAMDPGFESWQARQHAAYSGSPNYRVDVARAVHQSFSNFCEAFQVWYDYGIEVYWDPNRDFYNYLCNPPILPSAEAHRLINKYVVAFLTNQQSILTPGSALRSEPDIEFFVTEKRNPNAIDDDWPGDFTYFMHQPGWATSKAVMARAEKDPVGPRPIHFGYRNWRTPPF